MSHSSGKSILGNSLFIMHSLYAKVTDFGEIEVFFYFPKNILAGEKMVFYKKKYGVFLQNGTETRKIDLVLY